MQATDPAAFDPDAPYQLLQALPRTLWRAGLVTAIGDRRLRLLHLARWLQALRAGALPDAALDLGDAEALAAMRQAIGELGLPTISRGVPAVAGQALRSACFHLDRIAGLQPALSRSEAIAQAAQDFAADWTLQAAGLAERLRLLRGLGDLASLRWDDLQGQWRPREWQAAQQAAAWLAQLPALAQLIQRLGRSEASRGAPPRPQRQPQPAGAAKLGLRALQTRLPGAPGEVTGIVFSGRPENMLPSEALMLRHPVLRKLWRARHAEARLLSRDTEAVLVDWRSDPARPPRGAAPPAAPEARERGPIVICLDTSGSMRGAPENIAKAAVIAALRAAHAQQRGVTLIAFGGPGEIVERELGLGAAGLSALLDLMGQGFDGGTDIQEPIRRAVERVQGARWQQADLLVVSDGEFGCTPPTLDALDRARDELGLRVQGVLVGDRETLGMLELCDHIHWVRDWRRHADAAQGGDGRGHSPVHSKSLTALYFPQALSPRAARHQGANAADRSRVERLPSAAGGEDKG